ncbi:hypothetical protein HGI09_40430 [Streptomyces collinus]|nr:hypothetical protein HGI10_23680 [Streptomyces collinus]UJA16682.1 hypothetical protein HGI09_40430 [Streptomyces collinus]
MRLCSSLSLCLAAAALLVPVSSQAAYADSTPSCAAPGDRAFPLTTRVHGGPTSYEAGGGYGTWYIDLTNTTGRACANIHPVVVLTDDKRALKPSQAELDFYDGARALPVTFEDTDEQELVGVLDGEGFDGFTVAPGKTVSVKVRLALASDAGADEVTANAAVVQRRGDDGDWVGESNAYRFGVGRDGGGTEEQDPDATREPGNPEGTGTPDGTREPRGTEDPGGTETPGGAETPGGTSASPTGAPSATPGAADPDGTSLPVAEEAEEAGERARELARTGPGLARGVLAATTVLLAVGGGAFLLARRRR